MLSLIACPDLLGRQRSLGLGLVLAVVLLQAATESEALREGGAVQASRIHHVGLPVSDLDVSVAWYRETLGLTHDSTAGLPGRVAFMVAPTGERLELLAVDVQPSAWDDPIAALRAGVPHTAWTVNDLHAAHARAVEAGGRSVWTPRDTPEPGLRIAVVADPDGNLVELLSGDQTSSSGLPSPRSR